MFVVPAVSFARQAWRSMTVSRELSRGAVFAVVWALSHIVHIWHQDEHLVESLPTSLPNLITLAAAVYLVSNPRSSAGLALLALTQLLAFVLQFPFVANHWTIAAFVNAGIVVAYLRGMKNQSERSLVEMVAPYARLIFLVAYGAAAIAKLNDTFLTPVSSCALATFDAVNLLLGWQIAQVSWIEDVVVWAVVATELAVPVLLLVPLTRLLGIAVAVVFHLSLAITPVVVVMDFTLLVIALVLLFAPSDFDDRVQADLNRSFLRRPAVARVANRSKPLIILAALALIATGAVLRDWAVGEAGWAVMSWGAFTVLGVLVAVIVLGTLSTYLSEPRLRMMQSGSRLSVPHLLLVALVLANALSPYIGFKTTSSFTMFSNLATEGGTTNHVFMPRFGLGGYQDDLVEVVDTNDPALTVRVQDGQMVVMHELRRALTANPTSSISYVHEGSETVTRLEQAAEDQYLVSQGWLEAKLLHFRPVARDGDPVCQP